VHETEHTLSSAPRPTDPGNGRPAGSRLRRSVRRSTLVLVALSVLVAFTGAALAYSLLLQPKVYGGQAEFVVTASPELSDAAADRAMLTQVEIVVGPTVLQPVARQAGMSVQRLQDAVS
jgi:hypothetical protein